MKTINEVGAIIKYKGKLCEVVSYATSKVLFIREVGAEPCKCCGEIKEYAEVENSPNFQENAEPVKTLSTNPTP
jgi:hypothetical protein